MVPPEWCPRNKVLPLFEQVANPFEEILSRAFKTFEKNAFFYSFYLLKKETLMEDKLTVHIPSDIIRLAENQFGQSPPEGDYSAFVEQVLRYFLQPKLSAPSPPQADGTATDEDAEGDAMLRELMKEPENDIEALEKNYSLDIEDVEGFWPGDEPVEDLMKMLTK